MDYETFVRQAATAAPGSSRRVRLIRDAYMSGIVMRRIAEPLGLSTARVGKILQHQGLSRRHRGLCSTFSTENVGTPV
jgi:hypothetical protein